MNTLHWKMICVIALMSVLSGCGSKTFWAQNFYFPSGSLPEDEWKLRAVVYVEGGNRFTDLSEKAYRILIKNKKGDLLYSESGKFQAGSVEATADWTQIESIKISVATKDGKSILERTLEYVPEKNVYELRRSNSP